MLVADLINKVHVDKTPGRLNAVKMMSDLMTMQKSRKCLLR